MTVHQVLTIHQMTWDDDYDGDGDPDDCDGDDDNDGSADSDDSDDNNELECSDDDGDTCDDCSSGSYDPSNDGVDGDGDGTCDNGDTTPGGEITLSFANATETTIDIEYASDVSIAGYQFDVDGVDLISASDGDLEIYAGNNTVIAFGMGVSLPACPDGGCAFASLLFFAELDGATIGLSNILVGHNGQYSLIVYGPVDATGLANITMQGLTGSLGSANAYGTKRPTGGA